MHFSKVKTTYKAILMYSLLCLFIISCSDSNSAKNGISGNLDIGKLDSKVLIIVESTNNGDRKALEELEELAKSDNIDANKSLALIYLQGKIVKKNIRKSINLFEAAADQGDKYAAEILSKIYLNNNYFDKAKAIKYKEIALNGNNTINIITAIKNYKTQIDENKWVGYKFKSHDDLIGTGSAFAINDQGLFVTNRHVISKCNKVVVGYNRMLGKASYVLIDENADLAFIKVNEKTPAFLKLSQQKAKLGEKIFVGGYPLVDKLGFDLKMTDGIVSGAEAERSKKIQVTASMSSGNSGGPVVDEKLQIVGIATSVSTSGLKVDGNVVGHGVNFATNTDAIRQFALENKIELPIANGSNKKIENEYIADMLKITTGLVFCLRMDQ